MQGGIKPGFAVPAGAVDHQDDETLGSGAGFAGEQREQCLEERLGDTVGELPQGLAARRRDEGGDVEPLEAMVPKGHRALAARRPAAPAERLQTEPVLVAGEDLDGLARVALGLLRDHLGEFF